MLKIKINNTEYTVQKMKDNFFEIQNLDGAFVMQATANDVALRLLQTESDDDTIQDTLSILGWNEVILFYILNVTSLKDNDQLLF